MFLFCLYRICKMYLTWLDYVNKTHISCWENDTFWALPYIHFFYVTIVHRWSNNYMCLIVSSLRGRHVALWRNWRYNSWMFNNFRIPARILLGRVCFWMRAPHLVPAFLVFICKLEHYCLCHISHKSDFKWL